MKKTNKRTRAVSDERAHSKFKLFGVIIHALEHAPVSSGLVWFTPPPGLPQYAGVKMFAMNGARFIEYYAKVTGSTAVWNSIKNRLTRSKTGFYALACGDGLMPPMGYTKLYTHKSWTSSEGFAASVVSTQALNTISDQAASHDPIQAALSHAAPGRADAAEMPPMPLGCRSVVGIATNDAGGPNLTHGAGHAPKEEVPTPVVLDDLLGSERIPARVLETMSGPWGDPWTTYKFDVLLFVGGLRAIQGLQMNDYDKTNFELLILGEQEAVANTYILSTSFLHQFGWRFGPWGGIVRSVREFVSDGAAQWFHGVCDDNVAAEAVLATHGSDREFFIVRALTLDPNADLNLKPCFVLTRRVLALGIRHHLVYRTRHGGLGLINNMNELELFRGFAHIIRSLLRADPAPVANPRFARLIEQPVGLVASDLIGSTKGYSPIEKGSRL